MSTIKHNVGVSYIYKGIFYLFYENIFKEVNDSFKTRGNHGRHGMVVGFSTTYAINAYHH